MGLTVDARLLSRFAAGTCDAAERARAEELLAASAEARRTLDLFRAALRDAEQVPLPDPDALWENTLRRSVAIRAAGTASRRAARPPYAHRLRTTLLAAGSAVAAAAVALIVLVGPAARLASPLSVAALDGRATLTRDGVAVDLAPGIRLDAPCTVACAPGATLHLVLPAGELVLKNGTALDVLEAATRDGRDSVVLRQRTGLLFTAVDKGRVARMRIETPRAVLEVTGTRFAVSVGERADRIVVGEGTLEIAARGEKKPVTAGERAAVDGTSFTIGRIVLPSAAFDELERAIASRADADRTNASGDAAVKKGFTERVTLADGTVLTGRVVAQDTSHITVETSLGTMRLPRARVAKVDVLR